MSNRLAQEKSPYLLQHKDNPVDWYPWGEEAFALARERDCPIFLSIGYSTCYWCHVMEQDSFEHDDVAQALNQKFVCIKIDKEERPDVDAIYMDVVVGLTGHGGWPMTVFLTPELKPFWGGTFFWKKQLLAILPQITSAWENDRAAVMESGNKITQALSRSLDSVSQDADPDSFSILLNASQSRFDSVHGGFGAAPKFPPAEHLRSLLRVFARTQDAQALEIINKTLQAMARGGIYDQLGGGFHRYSTDAGWLVPHFEKMLYDNALLAITYFEAYQVTKEGFYKEIGCEILNYVQAQMTSAEGAFFSAQDAGKVGKEGEYYVWAHSELSSLLSPPELEEVEAVYSATKAGNFEGKYNIFCLSNSVAASRRNSELMNSARLKLLAQRGLRAAPHRDDKIITSWNGLMISAFALGARVTSNSSFLASAVSAASFLKKNLWDGKVLFRRYCDQQTAIPGFLEDYAYLIDGLLSLYEVSQNCEWFTWARELQLAQDFAFKHESSACYRFSTAQEIIAQKIDYLDNATPSANSVATLNNIRLFHFTAELSYYERAKTIIAEIYPHFLHYPTSSTKLLQAIDYLLGPTQELVFVASDISKIDEYLLAIRETFLPRTIFAFATPQSDSPPVAHGKQGISDTVTVYKCSNGVCEQPILSLSDFRSSLLT